LKAFIAAMAIVLMVLVADPKSCDKPAGSAGGDSAGNNQPDSKAQSCAVLPKVKVIPVGYVEYAGLTYNAGAYLMEGDCDVVDVDGESMKVTLAAFDSVGRRVPPVLDSSPENSPWSGLVHLALPTSYDIRLVVTGNLTSAKVRDEGVVFVGCQLIPSDTQKEPLNLKVGDIGAGKGKVECHVAKG
jgi:hypothetical protein